MDYSVQSGDALDPQRLGGGKKKKEPPKTKWFNVKADAAAKPKEPEKVQGMKAGVKGEESDTTILGKIKPWFKRDRGEGTAAAAKAVKSIFD